jgi:Zn-dependent metalloprotease
MFAFSTVAAALMAAGVLVAPARPAAAAPPPVPSPAQAADDARAAVQRHKPAVHGAAGEAYQVRGVLVDPDGSRHVRFDRTYRGLAVLGGDYVVHANPDGSFRDASVAQRAAIAVDIKPTVDAAAARSASRIAGRSDARLVVDASAGTPVLAWQIVGPRERTVIVDARTGKVRRDYDGIQTAETGTGHTLYDGEVPLSTTRGDGGYTLTDPSRGNAQVLDALDNPYPEPATSTPMVDADNVWGTGARDDRQTVAADVHYAVAETFDFFRQAYGRDGVRDDGTAPVAMVHQDDANAAFYGSCYCMSFGDGGSGIGPFVSLDVVGHEWAHGVTYATARLVYDGESGALNEASSDIFGTLVEFAAGNPADRPDYLVGEQLDNGGEGTPLRYMDEPARNGTSDSCWSPAIAGHDVHYSSGVADKFFYNLAVGSGQSAWGDSPTCGGAPPVTGIGNDKAGRIWYRALTTYMLSNTNYAVARQATLTAAADLYGAGGAEYDAVDAAWKAVNVDGSDPAPQEPAIWGPGNQESVVGDQAHLRIKAVDPQGDAITFSAVDLPAGLSISDDGLITGAPTTAGWEYVKVSVTDSGGHTGITYFFWDVYGPPVVQNPGDQNHRVGDFVFLPVQATDDDSDWQLTWTFTGLPDGLWSADNYIAGVPDRAGTWHTTVTVTDSQQRSTTIAFTWTIT